MRRVLLLAFIWGWSFLFIKVALQGLTPATVAFGRIVLGMAVMLVVLRARSSSLPRDAAAWRHFAVMGLMYSAVPFTLLGWSEQHITSALTAVVNASTPLFAAIAAALGLRERLRAPQLLGLALGFLGVAVAAGVGGRDLASSSAMGVGATLAASACYGFSFVYARRHLGDVPPLVAACGQLVCGALLAAPLALVTTLREGASLNARQGTALLLLGVLGTGVAYVVNYRSIAEVGPTRASLVTYLVPIVAVTVGVVFLGEPFRFRLVAGGALTVAGVSLLQDRLRRARAVPVVAALLALLLLGGCGNGAEERARATTTTASGCGPAVEDPLDPRSTQHLLPGAPEPTYATDPPTSGPHLALGSPPGAVDQPLPRPVQVGVLEGGGVVVQHRGLAPGDRARLEALAGDGVVVAPNPAIDSPVVATAWRHRLRCGRVDVAALRAFIAAYRGKGPGH